MKTVVKSAVVAHQETWDMGFHEHEDAEFSVVLEGRGFVQQGESVWPIQSGHVVVIPPDISHRYWASSPIRFGVYQVDGMPPSLRQLFDSLTPTGRLAIVTLPAWELKAYETMFRSCLRMISQPMLQPSACARSWTEVLLLFLQQHAHREVQTVPIPHAADYIRMNLTQDIRVAELAQLSGLSVSAFRSAFVSAYGISPKEYQQSCRLAEAKWLLRSSTQSLQQIAEAVGFQSLPTFSRWFKEKEGHSASEWRKMQQGSGSRTVNGG